jgi:hypothetical protein
MLMRILICLSGFFIYSNLFGQSILLPYWDKTSDKWGYITTEEKVVLIPQFASANDVRPITSGIIAGVNESGKYGVVNYKGETIVPFAYYEICDIVNGKNLFDPENRYFHVTKSQYYGKPLHYIYKVGSGELKTTTTAFPYGHLQEGRIKFSVPYYQSKLYGFIDTTGKVVIEAYYGDVSDFKDGLAIVKNSGNISIPMVIDKESKKVIDIHSDIKRFGVNFLVQRGIVGPWAIFNSNGETVLPFQLTELIRIFEGAELAVVVKEGKYGVINTSGKEMLPFKFNHDPIVSDINEKVFTIKENDSLYLVDKTGKYIINGPIDTIPKLMYNETIQIRRGGKNGVIDFNGKIIIPTIYDNRDIIYNDHCYSVHLRGKKGFIDEKGRTVLKPVYDSISHFNEGFATAKINNKWAVVDKKGRARFGANFILAFPFYEHLALVKDSTGYKYIDTTGKTALKGPFHWGKEFQNGFAYVEEWANGDFKFRGYINAKGNHLIDPLHKTAYKPVTVESYTPSPAAGKYSQIIYTEKGQKFRPKWGYEAVFLYGIKNDQVSLSLAFEEMESADAIKSPYTMTLTASIPLQVIAKWENAGFDGDFRARYIYVLQTFPDNSVESKVKSVTGWFDPMTKKLSLSGEVYGPQRKGTYSFGLTAVRVGGE